MIPRFSPKQLRVLRWWGEGSEDRVRDAVICDGAVRSGKTLCLGLAFLVIPLGVLHKALMRGKR